MTYVDAPNLISYAGQEGRPKPQRLSAYSMFLLGYNTVQIAEHLQISEAVASKRIQVARDKKRGLKTIFERRA